MKTGLLGEKSVFCARKSRARSGFTLVEVLVVMVIIAVLAAAVMSVSKRWQDAARAATCMSNVKQVGMALLMHAGDNNNKLIPLQPSRNDETGRRPPIWPVQLAGAGYLSQWDGTGTSPTGTGVWTCPDCDFMSNAYGGYGVVEGAIFVYEEFRPQGVLETGSLRLNMIADPVNTWLVGDATANKDDHNKGWYAIWADPARWNDHGPALRHGGKANVCMMDGHVERLTLSEIRDRKLTQDVVSGRR